MKKVLLFTLSLGLSFGLFAQQLTGEVVEVNSATETNVEFMTSEGIFFLPDGSGETYSDTLLVENMPEGMLIQEESDFSAFLMNIEHSYVGDLSMELVCPTGETLVLIAEPEGISSFLGEPIDDESDNAPGIGYDYLFTPDAEIGWVEFLNVTGSHESLPSGEYYPTTDWSTLVGCPLNGNWILNVTDNFNLDNGYIFYWQLFFNTELIPSGVNEGSATVSASGGVEPYTYAWNTGNETPTIVSAAPGNYSVTITDSEEAQVVLEVVIPQESVLGTETLTNESFSIYPNPASSEINIEMNDADDYSVSLVDMLGKVILQEQLNGTSKSVSLDNVPNGVYFLNIKSSTFSEVQKIRISK